MKRILGIALLALVLVYGAAVAFAQTRTTLPTVRRPEALPSALPQAILQRPLPPMPPAPKNGGAVRRRVQSSSGATINVTAGSGCTSGGSAIAPVTYAVGCAITWQATGLQGTAYKDAILAPGASTPTLLEITAFAPGASPTESSTLSVAGTYVLGTLNTTTNNWDALVYIVVGTPTYFDTYSDPAGVTRAQNFVADGAHPVYLHATGLASNHHYIYLIENTSNTGNCVYTAPVSTVPTTTLCNPTVVTGVKPSSGVFDTSWTPNSSSQAYITDGTYSISLYDQGTSQRVEQRQVNITTASNTHTVSIYGTSAAGTIGPVTRIAYDNNSIDANETYVNIAAKGTGFSAFQTLRYVFSDPNGHVVENTTVNADGTGTVPNTTTWSLTAGTNTYTPNTYTATFSTNSGSYPVLASGAFQVLGYDALVQFTNPVATSVAITGGNVVTGIQVTNDADAHYGTGNGDGIKEILFTSDASFSLISLLSGTSCGSRCQTQTVTDSDGQSWTAVLTCTGGCGGGNRNYTMDVTPVTAGQYLKPGSVLTIPNMSFSNSGPSQCNGTTNCKLVTQIYPVDGFGLSSSGASSTAASNNLYFTDDPTHTYSATGTLSVVKIKSGTVGQMVPGYTPRFTQAVYAANQPRSGGSSQNVLDFHVNNTSSLNTATVFSLALIFPPNINTSTIAVDSGSPNAWIVQSCPSGVPLGSICVGTTGSNTGLAPQTSQDIWLDVDPPTSAASYTDITGQVVNYSPNYAVAAASQTTVFVGNTNPQTVDSIALGSYSLNYTLMTGAFSPSSLGVSGTYPVTVNLTNTSSGSDPFPDYIDLMAVDVPSGTFVPNSGSGQATPSTFSVLNPTTPVSIGGGNVRYFVGLCAGQNNNTYGPTADSPVTPSGSSNFNCGSTLEQGALAPGATLSINGNVTTATSNISGTLWAHGANGNGWSQGIPITLTISGNAASSGFSQYGNYGAPNTIPTNTQPQTGGDSNTTYGNSYVYSITNNGTTAVTSATIAIPGKDNTGANGADSGGVAWTVTAAPTIIGTTYGCSIVSYSSATTAGVDGSVVIGGGGCSLGNHQTLNIALTMKSPYRVNTTYNFPTLINGSYNATETWNNDQTVQVIPGASLVITVNPPASGSGGSTGVAPACAPSTCTFGTNKVDFGTVPANSTATATDVVRTAVSTDVASPQGWKLYVSADVNPSNVLSTMVDAAHSITGVTNFNVDQTTFGTIPVGPSTLLLVDTGSGTAARRNPFDIINDYQLVLPAGANTGSVTLTYTFIAN